MSKVVLDASALLSLLNDEAGADLVEESISKAVINAVNLSEVVGKLAKAGMPEEAISHALKGLDFEVLSFGEEDAYSAGLLRPASDEFGLSLGDRVCLNTARKLGIPALTTDKAWGELSVGIEIRLIR